jgi:B-box zinc finger/zinc finger of C3HC4-type, RING
MASMTDLHKYVDELTTCSICLDFFVDPRSLPCLHTFCLKCIQAHCKGKCPGDDADCPICRSTFTIPNNGVEEVRSNFLIKGLADVQIAANKPADIVSCDGCSENGENSASSMSPASMYCIGCGQKLCERCSKPHQRIPDGTHKVVALASEVRKELLKPQGAFCRQHTTKRLQLYCISCKQNICLTCLVSEHRKHDCEDINEIYREYRLTIEHDLQQVSYLETNVLQLTGKTDSAFKQFVGDVQDVENTIQTNAREMKDQIDKVVDELLKELAGIKTASSKDISETKDRLQFQLASLQSFTRYCEELLNSGKPCDITHGYNDIHTRASELIKQDKEKIGECQLPKIIVTGDDVYNKLCGFILQHSDG